jgi:cobalamin biosynthesis protein CobD/CbiB
MWPVARDKSHLKPPGRWRPLTGLAAGPDPRRWAAVPGSAGVPAARRIAVAAGVVAGAALDALIGDPRRGHPVAAFGRGAAAIEARDYADSRPRGAAHTAICVLAVAAPAAVIQRQTRGRPLLRFAAVAAATWAVTGARSLRIEADRAYKALAADDIQKAREILPSLCGRDPSDLGGKEIARAVIESVAENTSDAVVAPLLWGAVAGLPGLVAYRAINTLDAMVGHHSPRYERFGWASARLDDVANYVPARVTALLTAACAPLVTASAHPHPSVSIAQSSPLGSDKPPTETCQLRNRPATDVSSSPAQRADGANDTARACRWRQRAAKARAATKAVAETWRVTREYGSRHPSPNAGQCEAAFAGALGIRLGGTNVYHGIPETRPELGDARPPETDDIRRAIALSRAVTAAATMLAVMIAKSFTRYSRQRSSRS